MVFVAICLQNWTWTTQVTKGCKPNPRQNATMLVEDTIIYIHGGRANLIFDDMYVVSIVNYIWIKVMLSPSNHPKSRQVDGFYGHYSNYNI